MSAEIEIKLPALGPAEAAEMTALGIVRAPIDSYRVGVFRYGSLKDAVAQARRSR